MEKSNDNCGQTKQESCNQGSWAGVPALVDIIHLTLGNSFTLFDLHGTSITALA